jgi:integrase
VHQQYGAKDFHYRFHDTRATFGMNLTDHQFTLIEQGKATLKSAREFVQIRMGHESSTTTDRYLQYRQSSKLVHRAGEEYESHLRRLSERAMEQVL